MSTNPTATELLENLRQILDLPTCLDLAAASALRLEECINALETRISTTENALTKLKDQVTELGQRCADLSCELCAAVAERDTAREEAGKYRRRCSDLHDDLCDAVEERDTAREEAKDARDAVDELRDCASAAADEIHDRHPHLLDDLLDYTAHLRHTGADRKTIALLELTTSTLRTISSLLN